jgi:hypothetical protein
MIFFEEPKKVNIINKKAATNERII